MASNQQPLYGCPLKKIISCTHIKWLLDQPDWFRKWRHVCSSLHLNTNSFSSHCKSRNRFFIFLIHINPSTERFYSTYGIIEIHFWRKFGDAITFALDNHFGQSNSLEEAKLYRRKRATPLKFNRYFDWIYPVYHWAVYVNINLSQHTWLHFKLEFSIRFGCWLIFMQRKTSTNMQSSIWWSFPFFFFCLDSFSLFVLPILVWLSAHCQTVLSCNDRANEWFLISMLRIFCRNLLAVSWLTQRIVVWKQFDI